MAPWLRLRTAYRGKHGGRREAIDGACRTGPSALPQSGEACAGAQRTKIATSSLTAECPARIVPGWQLK